MASRSLPALTLSALFAGCGDRELPSERAASPMPSAAAEVPAPPAELADALRAVSFGSRSIELWPFTGKDLSGVASDPVNLLFVGEADPANIRSALLALDGDRTALGFPAEPPFDCVWRDAAGGLQVSWAGEWIGSALQLECGEYEGLRFHLRLFPAGEWTLANVHFETLIPGTADHQVLSWDLAERLMQADLVRTGLLDPQAPFGAVPELTPSPTFRDIPVPIYNALPVPLRALIGGPLDPVNEPVGTANDGTTLLANLAGRAAPVSGPWRNDFTVGVDQVVPTPVCASSTADWIHASGPVRFVHRVAADARGDVTSEIEIAGDLRVTPVDPTTGASLGAPRLARATDRYFASTLGSSGRISAIQRRLVAAPFGAGATQREQIRLRVEPGGVAEYSREEDCGS